MDPRLAKLIRTYQERAAWVVSLFPSAGIAVPTSGSEWAGTRIPQKGRLNADVLYFKHGFGLGVHYPGGVIDFDFGEGGRIDGFNLGRLTGFASNDPYKFGFASDQEMAAAFEEACNQGEVLDLGAVLCFLREER